MPWLSLDVRDIPLIATSTTAAGSAVTHNNVAAWLATLAGVAIVIWYKRQDARREAIRKEAIDYDALINARVDERTKHEREQREKLEAKVEKQDAAIAQMREEIAELRRLSCPFAQEGWARCFGHDKPVELTEPEGC